MPTLIPHTEDHWPVDWWHYQLPTVIAHQGYGYFHVLVARIAGTGGSPQTQIIPCDPAGRPRTKQRPLVTIHGHHDPLLALQNYLDSRAS
ncbi:hypothetical protein [Nesterenkonia flava]|uniref:Uncharacterized protein n=1 Tax=Nesterenkonia flava TaxID=469799 RepID=A0ABU1FW77_9MICC|nr:hypothetical protein [Nesterenkonia flava]MDR5712941.1 hypothetical protein [Nesterenkonia flava]